MKGTLATTDAATPATSFRLFLQSELAQRCARNPQYSLRAFAEALDVDHSTLSQWLRGRRPMTARAIEQIGRRLGIPTTRLRTFIGRAPSDGPEMAILELLRLDEFRADSRWIARVLDIAVDEVNMALQRLLRLGLLEMASPERWIDRSLVQLFVQVESVADYVARAERIGARTIVPPQKLPDGDELAIMVDPLGMPFGLMGRRD